MKHIYIQTRWATGPHPQGPNPGKGAGSYLQVSPMADLAVAIQPWTLMADAIGLPKTSEKIDVN
jgi:hypothetical protein